MKKNYSFAQKTSRIYNRLIISVFLTLSTILLSSSVYGQTPNCTVNSGIAENVCENESFNLKGAVGANVLNYVWEQVSGPSVIIVNPTTDLTPDVLGLVGGNNYTFRLTANCTNGFPSTQTVVINVDPITTANAGADIIGCPGNYSLTSTNTTLLSNEVGVWSVIGNDNAGVAGSFTNSPTTSITFPTSSSGVSKLEWKITNSVTGCVSRDYVNVTNYGGEIVEVAGFEKT